MNNTAIGNSFREHVLCLLKSRFPDAHGEGKATWKNADIIFTMMELGKRIRVAVECKNYSRALNTSDFSSITADYHSALVCGDINLLLIVASRPVESASRQFIEHTPNLRFMTLAELERWLVGLEPYIRSLADQFKTDEVHEYYVEGRFEDGKGTAFEQVQAWVQSPEPNNTGMAVLGGYGVGKSSLAKRVASAQAASYLASPETERMPILLPLGQTVHETELAGLFGKHFTSRFSLENYSFNALLQLNSAGRLLIILDGFDEMKHAMTEHDFRSNFREFNKLRSPKAKVLLLGRPNAFTSESSDLLIRGLSKLGGQVYADADFPAWTEHKLAFFTSKEQVRFLDSFLRVKSPAFASQAKRKQRITEVRRDIDHEILQRPVQARIVGLLAADTSYRFKGINRYRLYSDFVEQVIRRDQEKRARGLIPSADRHKFLRLLAWWAWTRPGVSQGTFRREEVPDQLFLGLSNGQALDQQAKRTEYLVSSLTEEKDSNFLYFAHRSFHEFLVASHITSMTAFDNASIAELSAALSAELIGFLREADKTDYLHLLYNGVQDLLTPAISPTLISLFASCHSIISLIVNKKIRSVTALDVLTISSSGMMNAESLQHWLGSVIKESSAFAANAAAFVLVNDIATTDDVTSPVVEMVARGWERIVQAASFIGDVEVLVEHDRFCCIGQIFREWTRKLRLSSGNMLLLNLKEARAILAQNLIAQGFVGVIPLKGKRIEEMHGTDIERFMDTATAYQYKEIYSLPGDEFMLVRGRARAKATRRKKV